MQVTQFNLVKELKLQESLLHLKFHFRNALTIRIITLK